jgi:hypothetical protein
MESSLLVFEDILSSEHPQKQFELVAQRAKECFPLHKSHKHMVGRDLGRLESTPSLEYRAKSVLKTA